MKFLLENEHGMQLIAGLSVMLALNVVIQVGRFLLKMFETKSNKNDRNIKDFHSKIDSLSSQMARADGQLEHLMNLLSSYMETTITFAEKMGAVERQFHGFTEKMDNVESRFSEISKFDDDMRKFSSAIKWLAGNRWEELREAILDDDIRS